MNHLGVFAKYWQPGRVKTRLARSIGPENAANLYRVFVSQTLQRQSTTGDQRTVSIWPHENEDAFRRLAGNQWTIGHQTEGDLGQRMRHFFETQLTKNSKTPNRVVLIGTDSPTLPRSVIEDAFIALEKHDCVLGPSEDGGYYLIGLAKPIDYLFEEIAWSSERVFSESARRLDSNNALWLALPKWNDVDDLEDLNKLKQKIELDWGPKAASVSPLDRELLEAINKAKQEKS